MWGADDDGFDDNGNVLLPFWVVPFFYPEYGMEFLSVHFFGFGEGTAVNAWNGLEPGDPAKLKFGQLGVPAEWPIDYITVY
jgi:hypothetical protein